MGRWSNSPGREATAECGYLMESEADEIRAAEVGPTCNRRADPFHRRIEDPCSKLQGIFDRKECGLFYDSLAFAVQAAPTVPSPQACLKRRLMYRKYVWLWLCMWKTQRL